jgi:hypothetical protein
MDSLTLQGTRKIPTINFDALNGIIELSGNSTPENPYDFYEPLLQWVDNYCMQPSSKTIIKIKLEYLNSSSSKLILVLLKKFELLHRNNNDAIIKWQCEEDDWDMIETAELYKSIVKIPFEIDILA